MSVFAIDLLGAFSVEAMVPLAFGGMGGSADADFASAFGVAEAVPGLGTVAALAGTGVGTAFGRAGLSASGSVINVSAPVISRSLSNG